jgi:flavin-dependent dehydrogenase
VIVIGGGPGGSTVSTLLSQYGYRVLLLEREFVPRYHIGESLIPYTWFTLNRLGVVDWLRQSACPKKYSVQFVSITGKVSQPFYFFSTIKHECSQTWQVWRGEFDAMLLDNAKSKGVEVRQGVTVRDVIMEGSRVVGVRADTKDPPSPEASDSAKASSDKSARQAAKGQEIRAKVVVDATGRDSLLTRKFEWKSRDRYLNKIAVWSYWKGAMRDPGLDEGATTVAYVPHKGWFWYIPMHSNIVSVGIVAEPGYLYRDTRDPEAIYQREIDACTWIRDHVQVGTRCEPVKVTGEYSYHSSRIGGDGFCLVGDAFAFLDPLFSTGVFLALKSGEMAADAVHAALSTDGQVSAHHFDEYFTKQKHSVTSFRRLVMAFYDESFSFREFLQVYPEMNSLIIDTLVGNVFTDLEPLYKALKAYNQRAAKSEIDATTA